MDEKALILSLLPTCDWGKDAPLVRRFLESGYAHLLEQAVTELQLEALYQSPIHGVGHILRTMVHGAMGAMEEGLSPEETVLLLECCAYHDVGRVNDREDTGHGGRSAGRLSALTGRKGLDLAAMQASVTAHSMNDSCLPQVLKRYQVEELPFALTLARLLKDADGLDRVRIWDLDPRYLRFPHSVKRAGFAKALYLAWQTATGGKAVPDFVRAWKGLDSEGNPLPRSSS